MTGNLILFYLPFRLQKSPNNVANDNHAPGELGAFSKTSRCITNGQYTITTFINVPQSFITLPKLICPASIIGLIYKIYK